MCLFDMLFTVIINLFLYVFCEYVSQLVGSSFLRWRGGSRRAGSAHRQLLCGRGRARGRGLPGGKHEETTKFVPNYIGKIWNNYTGKLNDLNGDNQVCSKSIPTEKRFLRTVGSSLWIITCQDDPSATLMMGIPGPLEHQYCIYLIISVYNICI